MDSRADCPTCGVPLTKEHILQCRVLGALTLMHNVLRDTIAKCAADCCPFVTVETEPMGKLLLGNTGANLMRADTFIQGASTFRALMIDVTRASPHRADIQHQAVAQRGVAADNAERRKVAGPYVDACAKLGHAFQEAAM